MAKMKPLSENALRYVANIIEEIFGYQSQAGTTRLTRPIDTVINGSSDVAAFFNRAGCRESLLLSENDYVLAALVRLQSQQDTNGKNKIFKIIEQLCDPEEYLDEQKKHKTVVKRINKVLSPYNLKVMESGKIFPFSEMQKELVSLSRTLRTRAAKRAREADEEEAARKARTTEVKLFDTRKFHPEVQKHGRKPFLQKEYEIAVFECCKAFDKYVRAKSKLSLTGTKLMSEAFSPDKKCLYINTLSDETEKDEQKGLMYLCMGLISAFRNPNGHEPKLDRQTTKQESLDTLTLISLLYYQVDKTTYVGI